VLFQSSYILRLENKNENLLLIIQNFDDTCVSPSPCDSTEDDRFFALQNRLRFFEDSKIDFYAYGDSITRAAGSDDLSPDGSDSYIVQMVTMNAPQFTALNNMDGGGMNSSWGVEVLPSHYDKKIRYFVYMFTNDGWTNIPDNETVRNYLAIYDYVHRRGSIPVPCMPVFSKRPSSSEYTVENQTRRIQILESALDERGISYIKMYDALDSVPMNGIPDDIDTTYMADGVHPGREGQKILGQYLWQELLKNPGFIADISVTDRRIPGLPENPESGVFPPVSLPS